jgi:hypothetical protein
MDAVVANPPERDARAAQLTDHFTERCILAADLIDIGHPQTVRELPRLFIALKPRWETQLVRCAKGTSSARFCAVRLGLCHVRGIPAPKRPAVAGRITFDAPFMSADKASATQPERPRRVRQIVESVRRRYRPAAVGPLHPESERPFTARRRGSVKIGMRGLEVTDYFEIDALDLRQIDLLHVDEPQELAHGLGHLAPAFIARAATLRDADLGPELFLIEPEAAPDFARIEDAVKYFHAVAGSSGVGVAAFSWRGVRRFMRSCALSQARLYQWHILSRIWL